MQAQRRAFDERGARTRAATRSRPRAGATFLLLFLAASGCDGSDSGGDGRTAFNSFVREQIDVTADNTDPVPVNGLEFRFDEDPDAFDDLFP